MRDIGMLVHGRHVQAKGWEDLEWGSPPDRLGALPKLVKIILTVGIENVKLIVFGTGASERDGLKEAEYTKKYLLENMTRLGEFTLLKKYPEFQSRRGLDMLNTLLNNIVTETQSQNTMEEVRNAAKLFAEAGVKNVFQISCGSHISRCIRDRLSAGTPPDQEWYGVPDDTFFDSTAAKDVVIMEPPHRGDDPMINALVKPHQIFPRFFRIGSFEAKTQFLDEFEALLKKYGV